jgi:hypothetical protein
MAAARFACTDATGEVALQLHIRSLTTRPELMKLSECLSLEDLWHGCGTNHTEGRVSRAVACKATRRVQPPTDWGVQLACSPKRICLPRFPVIS